MEKKVKDMTAAAATAAVAAAAAAAAAAATAATAAVAAAGQRRQLFAPFFKSLHFDAGDHKAGGQLLRNK